MEEKFLPCDQQRLGRDYFHDSHFFQYNGVHIVLKRFVLASKKSLLHPDRAFWPVNIVVIVKAGHVYAEKHLSVLSTELSGRGTIGNETWIPRSGIDDIQFKLNPSHTA